MSKHQVIVDKSLFYSRKFKVSDRAAIHNQAAVKHSCSPEHVSECQHSFTAIWRAGIDLVNCYIHCQHCQSVSCVTALKQQSDEVTAVLSEYQQALSECRTQTGRRKFEKAIAFLNQQLQYIKKVLGETQTQTISTQSFDVKHPLELNRRVVLGEINSFDVKRPLELKPKQQHLQVLGETAKFIEPKPNQSRKASGWLEQYTKNKKLKNGMIATYPRVEGERDPNNPKHWYWAYRYEEKKENAKSNNGYVTRAVSLPRNEVHAVQLAISCGASVEKILSFIRSMSDKMDT